MKESHIPQSPKDNRKKDYGVKKRAYKVEERIRTTSKEAILNKRKNKYKKKHHIDEFLDV